MPVERDETSDVLTDNGCKVDDENGGLVWALDENKETVCPDEYISFVVTCGLSELVL